MKLRVFRSTWGLIDASDGDKANVSSSPGVDPIKLFAVTHSHIGYNFVLT